MNAATVSSNSHAAVQRQNHVSQPQLQQQQQQQQPLQQQQQSQNQQHRQDSLYELLGIDKSKRNPEPMPLTEQEQASIQEFGNMIVYSSRYSDADFEYRHVHLPKEMLKAIPDRFFASKSGTFKLLWEDEWRSLGITQSLGWEHYEVHTPEPHLLLFKKLRS